LQGVRRFRGLTQIDVGKVIQQRIVKLDGHIRKCFDLLVVAHTQHAILQPMLGNQKLLDKIGREGKVRGFDSIRFTLYWSLVQSLVNIVADDDCRVPSILNFRKHFADAQVKELLKENFSVWPSSITKDSYADELKDFLKQTDKQEEDERRQIFDSRYDKVMKQSEELLNSTALVSMKTIRDKIVSHNELKFFGGSYKFVEPNDYGLKYGDEKEILEKGTLVFDDFFALTTQIYVDWNELKTLIECDAKEFWKE